MRKFTFLCNLTRITGTLQEDLSTFIVISFSVLLRIRTVSDKSCRESQNTRFMFNNSFFFPPPPKIMPCVRYVEKYCRAGQATDDNMAHARCMLGTYGYKDTLRICNAYCFATTTMAARTRHNDTLYVHTLSCKCGTPDIKCLLLLTRVLQGGSCPIVPEGPRLC